MRRAATSPRRACSRRAAVPGRPPGQAGRRPGRPRRRRPGLSPGRSPDLVQPPGPGRRRASARATSWPRSKGRAVGSCSRPSGPPSISSSACRASPRPPAATSTPWPARRPSILDTRKTTPGLRVLEKYAVPDGRGRQPPHEPLRHGPDQGQPSSCSSPASPRPSAGPAARSAAGMKIEVEVDELRPGPRGRGGRRRHDHARQHAARGHAPGRRPGSPAASRSRSRATST